MSSKMGRPKLENPINVDKTIRFSQLMVDKINELAKKSGVSFGKVVRDAVDEYLK